MAKVKIVYRAGKSHTMPGGRKFKQGDPIVTGNATIINYCRNTSGFTVTDLSEKAAKKKDKKKKTKKKSKKKARKRRAQAD